MCVYASSANAFAANPLAIPGLPASAMLFELNAVTSYVAAAVPEVDEPKFSPTGTSEHVVKF